MTTPDEARRDRRFRCRIPAALVVPTGDVPLLTSDVSPRGVFVRSDDPPALHELVRLRLGLPLLAPADESALVLDGTVIHVLEPDAAFDGPPGFGVAFAAMERSARAKWDAFIQHVMATYPQSEHEPVLLAPRSLVDRIHRKHARHDIELRVRLQTHEGVTSVVTENISRGGVFVRTELTVSPGSLARVHIAQPSSQAILALDGVVARVERGVRVGVAIQFTDITEEMRDALMRFIGA